MLDLNDHIVRRQFITQLQTDVDKFCREEFYEDPRKHLGGSVIGDDCQAKIWGNFRWLKEEKHDGRQKRLFQRGHDEEQRFVRWLRGVGFTVWEYENEQEKKQFRITGSNGHFGGSLDGIGYREDVGYLLLEFKTHNDNSFKKVEKEYTERSKPVHYRQMCAYGKAYNLQFALYNATNKNNDNLYYEIILLDFKEADDLYRKADGIIYSQTQPPKIAQVETYFGCKDCHLSGICFKGEVPEKNCRSCKHAHPVENGRWACDKFGPIPDDFIPKGCDNWERIA